MACVHVHVYLQIGKTKFILPACEKPSEKQGRNDAQPSGSAYILPSYMYMCSGPGRLPRRLTGKRKAVENRTLTARGELTIVIDVSRELVT
jgi:hypothetical protein